MTLIVHSQNYKSNQTLAHLLMLLPTSQTQSFLKISAWPFIPLSPSATCPPSSELHFKCNLYYVKTIILLLVPASRRCCLFGCLSPTDAGRPGCALVFLVSSLCCSGMAGSVPVSMRCELHAAVEKYLRPTGWVCERSTMQPFSL